MWIENSSCCVSERSCDALNIMKGFWPIHFACLRSLSALLEHLKYLAGIKADKAYEGYEWWEMAWQFIIYFPLAKGLVHTTRGCWAQPYLSHMLSAANHQFCPSLVAVLSVIPGWALARWDMGIPHFHIHPLLAGPIHLLVVHIGYFELYFLE